MALASLLGIGESSGDFIIWPKEKRIGALKANCNGDMKMMKSKHQSAGREALRGVYKENALGAPCAVEKAS